ncbi:3'-5' exonuclease [Candidatus Parabeggiatoa sp. HSG14]|uniref:3'-5' exonuclease n=1 Tax=Candidatus Parabeggiatoa sp. HSG14 TaxID=3055593 RepID=UPI0025A69B7E|nr:3'-5' exonuclease [Thiotrichales bacterium HSG14]
MLDTPNKILVIDIEATCWRKKIPKGQLNEIIEVGICVLDTSTYEGTHNDSIIVKPNSEVSEFCTELTTLTQGDVDKGISLKEACEILQTKYLSRERIWASYGAYDRKQFQRECKAKGVDYPFYSEHINVKELFAETFSLRNPVGMASALRKLELPLEGTHHRGVDDAWNIAKILACLFQEG